MDKRLPAAVKLAVDAYYNMGAASTNRQELIAKTGFTAICETLHALGYGNTAFHVEGVVKSETDHFTWSHPRNYGEDMDAWDEAQVQAVAERLSLLYREDES